MHLQKTERTKCIQQVLYMNIILSIVCEIIFLKFHTISMKEMQCKFQLIQKYVLGNLAIVRQEKSYYCHLTKPVIEIILV